MNGQLYPGDDMEPFYPDLKLPHHHYHPPPQPPSPPPQPLPAPHTPEGSPQPPTMENILTSMEKVDKDIVFMDRVIKKVNTELVKVDKDEVKIEGIPVVPRKTEVAETVSLIEKIYSVNKEKAQQTNMSMVHLGCPLLEPSLPGVGLYKQPSDLPQYHDNMHRWKEGTFKKALVEYLWKKKQDTDEKEKRLADEYNTKYVVWQDKLKILEENPKRQKDLQQCKKYFESVFPTVKRKLEQEERFNRARSCGNAVQSEAELAEIVEQLTDHQETEDKQLECVASIPPMILNPVEKARRFYNENGRSYKPLEQHTAHMLAVLHFWTDSDKQIFKDKFMQYGKVFHKIAPHIPTKTIAQCIQYYYFSKKKENYKALLPKKKRKGIIPPKDLQIISSMSPATPRITRSKRVEHDSEATNKWTEFDVITLKECLRVYGKNWIKISKEVLTKTAAQCKHYYQNHRKRLGFDDLLKPITIGSYGKSIMKRKGDSESDESESNIDDFDVDPNVMCNVNAVIENGVLEGNDMKNNNDPAAIMKTLNEIENNCEAAEVRSIATSLATDTCSTLPPLEPHHDSSLPRPTTPDVIAMVSSIQEECAPPHPPPPPLHHPAANPPPLFSHIVPPQMPQIGAARLKPKDVGPATPPSMKRYPSDAQEGDDTKTPTTTTSTAVVETPTNTSSSVTFKNLPKLTAKSVKEEGEGEEEEEKDQASSGGGEIVSPRRKYILRQGRGIKTKEKIVKIKEETEEHPQSSEEDTEKEGYTILTPVETKDTHGNAMHIAGWIGECHPPKPPGADTQTMSIEEEEDGDLKRGNRKRQDSKTEIKAKDKLVLSKKKGNEKGNVDKKASVFKVYDFDSSEDEPLAAKTDKSLISLKRIMGRVQQSPSQPNVGGGGPIAAHITSKTLAKVGTPQRGGSETDEAEEGEDSKKKVSRPSSSSSSCDLPLCYDMSDETNPSSIPTSTNTVSQEDKQPSIRKSILKAQQDISVKQSMQVKENGPPISKEECLASTIILNNHIAQAMSLSPNMNLPHNFTNKSDAIRFFQSVGHPIQHQHQHSPQQQLHQHQQLQQQHQQQHQQLHQQQRTIMRVKSAPSPKTSMAGESHMKSKAKEMSRRDPASGQYIVTGYEVARHSPHAAHSGQHQQPVRSIPRVLQNETPRSISTGGSAFSQFKSSSCIIPRTEELDHRSLIGQQRSMIEQRALADHLAEQRSIVEHRALQAEPRSMADRRSFSDHRSIAEQISIAEQMSLVEHHERSIAEQRSLAEQRNITEQISIAEQRSIMEQHSSGLSVSEAARLSAEAQMRGLADSHIQAQIEQALARSMVESQTDVSRLIGDPSLDMNRQRMMHQELAGLLAAQSHATPNQLHQLMQQQQHLRALSEQIPNPELMARAGLPALLQQISQQTHFKGSPEHREMDRRLDALRKGVLFEQLSGGSGNMYVPRFYVPGDMIPIPSNMYSHNADTSKDGDK